MSASEFLHLFSSSPKYRRWFKDWWEEDFSTSGRKQSLQRNPQIQKSTFAGREWASGWTPPHDLLGKPNPSYMPISRTTLQQYSWQYYRSDLAGCFVEIENIDALTTYTGTFDWCGFTRPVSGAIGQQAISFKNAFFVNGINISISSHSAEIDISSTTVVGNSSIQFSRNSKYIASSTYVDGNATFRGDDLSGRCDRLIVKGNLVANGILAANDLRSGGFEISQSSARSGSPSINISKLKTKGVKVVGGYEIIDLKKAKGTEFVISTSGSKTVDLGGIDAASIKISGPIESVDLSSIVLSKTLSLVSIAGKTVTLNDAEIGGGIIVHDMEVDELFLDRVAVGGKTIFTKSKFSDNFFARSAEFRSPASFARCAFPGGLNLSGSKFLQGADFRTGSGSEVASDPIYSQVGEADFSNVLFEPDSREVCANFDGRHFLEAANFEVARFNGIPKFFGCRFHENTSFRGAEFSIVPVGASYYSSLMSLEWSAFVEGVAEVYTPPFGIKLNLIPSSFNKLRAPLNQRRLEQNKRLSEYERAYNALRQRFEAVGNSKEERRFHTFELRARRRRIDADSPLMEGFISRVYDSVSQYGQSISRPIWILFIVCWFAFALLYFFVAGVFTIEGFIESLVFAGRQIVKPFSSWSRDFVLPASYDGSTGVSGLSDWMSALLGSGDGGLLKTTVVRILASIQSLSALVMLFLSGLAIRRTFGVS